MEIYLVRHGKAEVGEPDAVRALTPGGRKAVRRVAERLQVLGARPDRIEHSPLLRAAETAEILGGSLGVPLREVSDLRPDCEVSDIRDRLGHEDLASLMLVGHNPFMEQLAGLLLGEDPDRAVLSFHTASAARLVSQGWGYSCDLLLTPDAVR